MKSASKKTQVKRMKFAHPIDASVAISPTYVKKKLPWLAWKAIKKRRRKTRTRFG